MLSNLRLIEKMGIEQTYLGVGNYYEFSEKFKLIELVCRKFFIVQHI